MHEFLNGIADAYLSDPDLRSYTFVFPNMRSKRYFEEYLAGKLGVDTENVSSLCLTFAALVEKGCGMTIAPTERLLFILYRAYRNVRKNDDNVESFDRFRYWGQMLLNDFNDVDRYLADAKELFRNASDYKKIQSFYLTPAQEEIIRTYWGSDPYWKSALSNRDAGRELPFWNHVAMKGEPERKFTQLWAILGEVYTEFRRLLSKTNECYPGMAYRHVAEQLMLGNRLPFNPKLYIFIGFNRLSHSEHAVFNQLNRQNLAHFYWDYNPAIMNHRDANTAARFIKTYVEEFTASKPDVNLGSTPATHNVNIIAVPSDIAQVKIAADYLHGNDTAMVLADGELLVPAVASIPEEYEQINVTMGLPVRFTMLAQLFSLLTSMQLRTRYDSDGTPVYFHDDVVALTSHPALQRAFPVETEALIIRMRSCHLYNLPVNILHGELEALLPLFIPIPKDAKPQQTAGQLTAMLSYMADRGVFEGIDRICLDDLLSTIKRLTGFAAEFGVNADRRTLFEMIEHTLLERTLPLEGESFEAMQVMGVLETRGLSFPNVVMLSMNEEVFPGTENSYSFIPETLRRAYGLPTRDHLETDSAYHFYRILSHADNLTVLYDARCGGTRTGQPSRYLTQLTYGNFPGVRVRRYLAEFPSPATDRNPLIALNYEGNKRTFAPILNKFTSEDEIDKYRLSASDLKGYLNCPLQFFLKKINDINPPELEREETGAADHGNVVHEVAERVYKFFKQRGENIPVTRDDLDALIAGGFDNLLERELVRAINIHFMHYPALIDGKENTSLENIPLDGKNLLYADAIRMSLIAMFNKEQTPFTILGTEVPIEFSWPVAPGLSVNFKMIIDRLDCVAEGNKTIYRIIDYKTGNDATTFPSVESLFEIGNPGQCKAIFQLLVYSAAYLYNNPGLSADCIRPMIFKLKEVKETEFKNLRFGSGRNAVSLDNYGMVRKEFEEALQKMFTDIFNLDEPIRRADNAECCTYCPFKLMCN